MSSNNYFSFGSYIGKAQEIPKSASSTSVVTNHNLHFYTTAVNIQVLKFKIGFLHSPHSFSIIINTGHQHSGHLGGILDRSPRI